MLKVCRSRKKVIYIKRVESILKIVCCFIIFTFLSIIYQAAAKLVDFFFLFVSFIGKLTDFSDDKDSFSQSDEDSDGARDDDDHFADDEGMSHHEDSSSVEYLDNYRFFEEDYEDHFYSPVLRLSYRKGKCDLPVPGIFYMLWALL